VCVCVCVLLDIFHLKVYFLFLQSGAENMERLMLHNVTLSDAGWYTCVVSNMYGQIQHSAWVEVLIEKSLPPPENYLYVAVIIALGLSVTTVVVLTAICWQRHRPPKTRPLVLKENSIYFQQLNLNLPVDPQWEIDRIQ